MENGKPSREWDKGSKASAGKCQQDTSDMRTGRKHLEAHHKEGRIEVKRPATREDR